MAKIHGQVPTAPSAPACGADNDLPLARRDAAQDLRLRVKLSDQDIVLELGLLDEHFQAHAADSGHDVIVSSNTLLFLFEHKFAHGTVSINSRIQFHYPTAHRFFKFFFIHYANNIGRHFRAGGLAWASSRSIANVAVVWRWCGGAAVHRQVPPRMPAEPAR